MAATTTTAMDQQPQAKQVCKKTTKKVKAAKKSKAKATSDKPKRPLSAFNLFYRFKRQAIIKASSNNDDDNDASSISKADAVTGIIDIMPGLEYEWYTPQEYANLQFKTDDEVRTIRRDTIRSTLEANLFANENSAKRSHRKTHGAMPFVEMNKLMCEGWKHTDSYAKKVFYDVAEDGRKVYRKKFAEYKKKNPTDKDKDKIVASKKADKLILQAKKKEQKQFLVAVSNSNNPTASVQTLTPSSSPPPFTAPVSPSVNDPVEEAIQNFDPFEGTNYAARNSSMDTSSHSIDSTVSSMNVHIPGTHYLRRSVTAETSSSSLHYNSCGYTAQSNLPAHHNHHYAPPVGPLKPEGGTVSVEDVLRMLNAKKSASNRPENTLVTVDDFIQLLSELKGKKKQVDPSAVNLIISMVSANECNAMSSAMSPPLSNPLALAPPSRQQLHQQAPPPPIAAASRQRKAPTIDLTAEEDDDRMEAARGKDLSALITASTKTTSAASRVSSPFADIGDINTSNKDDIDDATNMMMPEELGFSFHEVKDSDIIKLENDNNKPQLSGDDFMDFISQMD